MWKERFYEYSFSTALICVDIQVAQTSDVPRSTYSAAKTAGIDKEKSSLTALPIFKHTV